MVELTKTPSSPRGETQDTAPGRDRSRRWPPPPRVAAIDDAQRENVLRVKIGGADDSRR